MSAFAKSVFLRPASVEAYVRRQARHMGADDETVRRACQAAARALRAGETAHRAIVAGIEVAVEHIQIERRRQPFDVDVPPLGLIPSLFEGMLLFAGIGLLLVGLFLLALMFAPA
jgi:hypothetical protein